MSTEENGSIPTIIDKSKIIDIINTMNRFIIYVEQELMVRIDCRYLTIEHALFPASNIKHFEDINLQNLKNLVAYQEYYHSWIHFSSRAIYDGLGSFMNIPVIAIEKLPKPTNPYSRLKYKEEIILQKQLSRSNHILRLFDVTISENYSDIKRRWSDQILHKQRCKNEVLSPIKSNIINMIIDKIITKQTPFGTYNLCGTKTISSKDIMGFHASGEQIFKTGKMSFDVN